MNQALTFEPVNELCHRWGAKDEEFFQEIDRCGGWPLGMRFVSLAHSEERECIFGNTYLRTGWWTTVATSDEYYLWKVSKEFKEKYRNDEIRKYLMRCMP